MDTLIGVCPDEADVVALFFALQTQWRFHPVAGVRLGIDYAAIAPTASAAGLPMTPAMFHDLREMEGAALAVLLK